ncbi:MAG: YraN family protein [Minisyncoccia bacterium]
MTEPTKRQQIGRLGEDIATKYLENKGFSIIERNYLKKCGEIDIIAKKAGITHFIEVKSVTRENIVKNVSRVTNKYRPEDNLHPYKLKRLARVIQLYLLEKHSNGEPEWVFDAITVQIDTIKRQTRVKFLENIVL